jgi:hypothetical protein
MDLNEVSGIQTLPAEGFFNTGKTIIFFRNFEKNGNLTNLVPGFCERKKLI